MTNNDPRVVLRHYQEFDAAEGCVVGRDPRRMKVDELHASGHAKRPLLQAIRENCIECCGGSHAEVRRCGQVACPFWPYRMNANPFRKDVVKSEAKAASIAKLVAGRLKRQPENDVELHDDFSEPPS
jgi:hypothetical protein